MRNFLLFSFLLACNSPKKPKPITSVPVEITSALNPPIPLTTGALNRLDYIILNLNKRDSFLLSFYQNEALYYKTQNEKYRIKGNRLVDSVNKYVHILDSIAHQLNNK